MLAVNYFLFSKAYIIMMCSVTITHYNSYELLWNQVFCTWISIWVHINVHKTVFGCTIDKNKSSENVKDKL